MHSYDLPSHSITHLAFLSIPDFHTPFFLHFPTSFSLRSLNLVFISKNVFHVVHDTNKEAKMIGAALTQTTSDLQLSSASRRPYIQLKSSLHTTDLPGRNKVDRTLGALKQTRESSASSFISSASYFATPKSSTVTASSGSAAPLLFLHSAFKMSAMSDDSEPMPSTSIPPPSTTYPPYTSLHLPYQQ